MGEIEVELGDRLWGEDGEMVLASAGSEIIRAWEDWEDELGVLWNKPACEDELGVLGVVDKPEGDRELGEATGLVLDGTD